MATRVFVTEDRYASVESIIDAIKGISRLSKIQISVEGVKNNNVDVVVNKVSVEINGQKFEAMGPGNLSDTFNLILPKLGITILPNGVVTYSGSIPCDSSSLWAPRLKEVKGCCKYYMRKVDSGEMSSRVVYCPECGADLEDYEDGEYDLSFLD